MEGIHTRYLSGAIRRIDECILRNPLRRMRIHRFQRRLLRDDFDKDAEGLIVILTPGKDVVNGGILSIASIYRETVKLKDVHKSETLLCTIPGDPPLLKYTRFRNDDYLFDFSMVLDHFRNLKSILIHVPELAIQGFLDNLSEKNRLAMKEIDTVQMNVMLQNIRLLSDFKQFDSLRQIGSVSCTTAHQRYTTQEVRDSVNCPLHKFSTFVTPELYERRPYRSKGNLMIVSPDSNPHREDVMDVIRRRLPSLEIITIKDMTYEEFKETISRAKWSLTFGEGLDGYFVETVFSGGVSFAVNNPLFFTDDFTQLRTVYESYDALKSKICNDITGLDNESEFMSYQDSQHRLCAKHYDQKAYIANLRRFYEGCYTFP